ncbi:phosphotransferase [Bacillus taeanensis]|nr:phosphotransferase [Bacillus taeanensis]
MNHYRNSNGDDLHYYRLFFSFYQLTKYAVEHYKIIKKHVLLVDTKNGSYILKRYSTKNALLLQIALSKYLSKKNIIIPFKAFPDGQFFIEENGYWGIMPYIEGTPLNFKHLKDQQEGLNQLHLFHKETLSMCFSIQTPRFSLFSYWKKRYETFQESIYSVNMEMRLKAIADELLRWGKFALQRLPLYYLKQLEQKACFEHQWVHGDVASHNFLRIKDQSVLLLDCDLLAEAPIEYDYLQYLNRIMPYYKWKIPALNKLENNEIQSLLEKAWFYLALIYPTDLYREWNRYFRCKERQSPLFIQDMEMKFYMRYSTIMELMNEYRKFDEVNGWCFLNKDT